MRTRPILLTALLLLAAVPASATPIVRYTWGAASALTVDQPFAGPTATTQTVSVTGLTGTVSALDLSIVNGPAGVPAWQALFPATTTAPPTLDCLGGAGFEVSSTAAGASPVPGGATSVRVSTVPASITNPTPVSALGIHVTISPPLVADPATRYAIATLTFHHEASVGGDSGPGCWGADRPHCFALVTASAMVDDVFQVLALENGYLSWQGASIGTSDCLRLATPARGSSWGRVKTRAY